MLPTGRTIQNKPKKNTCFRFKILIPTFNLKIFLKEVIQPHLPVRLPCYDFTLVTNSTLSTLLQMVRVMISGITSFHGVTGGVYKARERIHRCVADQRLLAIPPSCRRVAAYNPNLE